MEAGLPIGVQSLEANIS